MDFNWVHLFGFVAACELLGAVGGIFTAKAIPGWYAKLKKPSFNPPNWIFGPVWTLLYGMQGVAIYLILRQSDNGPALALFVAQFILNMIWTPLFFGAKKIGFAFVEILFMLIFIVATIVAFFPLSVAAGWLMVPYAAWVGFASLLNYKIWELNGGK